MSDFLNKGFRIGHAEVRPSDQILHIGDKANHLEPKTMAVLVTLAESGPETVSREKLIERVWPRGHVTDDVLNRCISQLRTVLGDDPKSPRYIVTVPRIGYRLVARVAALHQQSSQGLLVLPFQNLAAHGQDEYLADGLTELLIARLAVVLNERVISRTTAMAYKNKSREITEIREQLGVKWLVEGSLLQLGEQLQIVVQLIDAETDAHVWAETWLRPFEDFLSVLNEVSRQVSTAINLQLRAPAPVQSDQSEPARFLDESSRRYLQGMHHASRRAAPSLRKAMDCFQDVLNEQPDHAPALSGMAFCKMLLVHYGAEPAAQGIPKVRKLSQKALEVDPGNADAYAHLAAVSFFYDWDFEKAHELIQTALEIRPNHEMALILAANIHLVNGNYEKSQSSVDNAIAVDPLNVGVLMNAGDILILQRRYGEAIKCLMQALEIEPQMRPAWFRLALAYALLGEHVTARDALQKARDIGDEDAVTCSPSRA